MFGFIGLFLIFLSARIIDTGIVVDRVNGKDILLLICGLLVLPWLGVVTCIFSIIMFVFVIAHIEFVKEDGKWNLYFDG